MNFNVILSTNNRMMCFEGVAIDDLMISETFKKYRDTERENFMVIMERIDSGTRKSTKIKISYI